MFERVIYVLVAGPTSMAPSESFVMSAKKCVNVEKHNFSGIIAGQLLRSETRFKCVDGANDLHKTANRRTRHSCFRFRQQV